MFYAQIANKKMFLNVTGVKWSESLVIITLTPSVYLLYWHIRYLGIQTWHSVWPRNNCLTVAPFLFYSIFRESCTITVSLTFTLRLVCQSLFLQEQIYHHGAVISWEDLGKCFILCLGHDSRRHAPVCTSKTWLNIALCITSVQTGKISNV